MFHLLPVVCQSVDFQIAISCVEEVPEEWWVVELKECTIVQDVIKKIFEP